MDINDTDKYYKEQYQKMLETLEEEQSIVACVQKLTSTNNFKDSMNTVLRTILEYYKAERAYIFEFNWNNQTSSNTYECCSEGVTPEKQNLQNVTLEVMGFWVRKFEDGSYIHIPDLEKIRTERVEEYETLKAQNIRSLMAVPFYYDQKLTGFIGVDDPKIHEGNIRYLRSLTYFISNEIAKQELHKKLTKLSYVDSLTKLYNRNRYSVYVEEFMKRRPENVGIVFVDLNGLKTINDTYGHAYGDQIIKEVAEIISQHFEDAYKFRLSGDEYVIICEKIPYQEFIIKVKEMQQRFLKDERALAACGYLWEESPTSLERIVNRADQLMYVNKQEYYKVHLNEYTKKPELLSGLLESIKQGKYIIYLQPKCKTSDEDVYGAEALIRRIDDNNDIIPPYQFIELFEKECLIAHIDFFVLEEVCKMIQRWKQHYEKKIVVSVNFSRITLMEEGFVAKVIKICNKYDITPEEIEIEITESIQAINKQQMFYVLQELKKSKFQIALDDFGTEYCSIQMLSLMDMDVLKIDISLIQKIDVYHKSRILIENILRMAKELGMKCVAEGVESKEQLDILRELKCDYIQGYYCSKPIPVEEFERKYMETNK